LRNKYTFVPWISVFFNILNKLIHIYFCSALYNTDYNKFKFYCKFPLSS